MNFPLIWVATLLSMTLTLLRALNIAAVTRRQQTLYLVSACIYSVFWWHDGREAHLFVLNGFYVIVSLIGAWRWR